MKLQTGWYLQKQNSSAFLQKIPGHRHHFPWLSMTLAVFHDFPGLENGLTKFHDFPGRVVTLGSETTSSPRWPGVVCPSNVFDALLSTQTITAEYCDDKKLGYFTKKIKVHPRSYGLHRPVLTAIFRARQPVGCHYILPGPQLPSQLQSHCT